MKRLTGWIVVFGCLGFLTSFNSGNAQQEAEEQDSLAPSAGAQTTATLPSDTDPRIQDFNEPHISWLPKGAPRKQLLLFIPGTGGKPTANFRFAKTASDLGYHVIFLMYPDNIAAQKKCGDSPEPNADMNFRLAIIQGGVIGPRRRISPPDSMLNRLRRLLAYLDKKQPGQGWSQYLDAKQDIAWQNLVLSGSSQGGGHAYVLAKFNKVARVIMFASPKDYSFYYNRPAAGFDGKTATPLNRFFAFNHMEDNGNGCTHAQQVEIFKQIGLDKLGIVNADSCGGNFKHARLIYSDEQLPDKKYHPSVSKGFLRVCDPVWKYMLSEPVQ